jgi:hypothetical protein
MLYPQVLLKGLPMLDVMTLIRNLRRPVLLARAARFGADDYRRDVVLPRLLKTDNLPRPAAAVIALLDLEAATEAKRRAQAGDYAPAHHVELLIAITAEARMLTATAPRAVQAKASGIDAFFSAT